MEECELLDSFQILEQVVGEAEGGDPLEVRASSNLLDVGVVEDYLLVVGEMLFFLKQFRKRHGKLFIIKSFRTEIIVI